ncbi:hypothetical protein JYU34_007342 [Plutella xylostella]|uniref:Glycolipid transfer protein domain-containing protein n=1 Tax=Plutella xylostella TaxID=51655 RepID=A0ABQ7QQ71_PLUXY|nr:hypothetical protein JYU34_007342 [Plutella xylostella]
MASKCNKISFDINKHFPIDNNNKINIVKFIEATSNLVGVIDNFGKLFTPVKLDIQGNIDNIKRHYKFDDSSCLLEQMTEETKKGPPVIAESVLWLNRSLLMFELIFQEMIAALQSKNYNVTMKKILTIAYEGSVKKYHNWVTQQIFHLLCKMFSTLPVFLKQFNIENIDEFGNYLVQYNNALHSVRCQIDNYFISNHLFLDS